MVPHGTPSVGDGSCFMNDRVERTPRDVLLNHVSSTISPRSGSIPAIIGVARLFDLLYTVGKLWHCTWEVSDTDSADA